MQVLSAARNTRFSSLLTTESVSLTFALRITQGMIPLGFIIVSFYLFSPRLVLIVSNSSSSFAGTGYKDGRPLLRFIQLARQSPNRGRPSFYQPREWDWNSRGLYTVRETLRYLEHPIGSEVLGSDEWNSTSISTTSPFTLNLVLT